MSLIIWFAVHFSIACQQPEPEAPAAAIPENAARVLEQNARELDGLEFVVAVEHLKVIDASTLPDDLKFLADRAYLEHFLAPEFNVVRIDGVRFYEKSTQGPGGGQIGERSFNGQLLYSGRPPAKDTESLLTIDKIDRSLAVADQSGFPTKHFYWNFFEDAGYHLPEFPNELGQMSSSLVLHLARQGRVLSWLEDSQTGRHEVVIESPDPWSQTHLTPKQIKEAVAHLLGESRKFQEELLQRLVERSQTDPLRHYRFFLDPTMGFAVREKREETPTGKLLSRSLCENFTKIRDRDVWLPQVCRTLVHACEQSPSYISPSPLYEIEATLQIAEPKKFLDSDFELWYDSPGGSVFDYSADRARVDSPVQYKVPANAADLAKASQSTQGRTRWLIVVNAAIGLAIAVYVILQRRLRTK